MVRVRYFSSGELSTAAMCPGCWNDHIRREVLLKKMGLMGVEPVHKMDLLSGTYLSGQKHSEMCPYNEDIDQWERFKWMRRFSK